MSRSNKAPTESRLWFSELSSMLKPAALNTLCECSAAELHLQPSSPSAEAASFCVDLCPTRGDCSYVGETAEI